MGDMRRTEGAVGGVPHVLRVLQASEGLKGLLPVSEQEQG